MLIDLLLTGEQALIVGEGQEPEFKALKVLDGKAKVTVVGGSFTGGLHRLASRRKGEVRLILAEPTKALVLRTIQEIDPRVVFISTGRPDLDEELSLAVRERHGRAALICVVDEPSLNDFNMPAIAKMGDIRVGVSTGGKSPAMAGVLRRKIEKVITRQDVLQVRLQGYIRKVSRTRLRDAASRKAFAYRVMRDKTVGALLRKEKYAEARRLAEKLLREEPTASVVGRLARGPSRNRKSVARDG
jgi:precorrin-2 dehydrogenase/sirohydrochlorin ferrochelatase